MEPRRLVVLQMLILNALLFTAAEGEPYEGETVLTPSNSSTTTAIDLDGVTTRTWHGTGSPASMAYLLEDGSILRPSFYSGGSFGGGGVGGRIQRIDENDVITWNHIFANNDYQQHHDIQPMPGGTVLIVAWERKSRQEAIDRGRQSINGEMWPTFIAEVEPDGATGGNIVWEWHFWDHMIQDVDPGKPSYGVISEHPELLDINYGGVQNGDWVHVNSLDYDEVNDLIIIGSRSLNEVYVIDHSTTTAEAASHSGGTHGKGGDILYRWGNPEAYQRGDSSDRWLYASHGTNWIDSGSPGAENILIFNNGDRPGGGNDYSTVYEVIPPRNPDGSFIIDGTDPFGPSAPTWSYGDPGDFYGGPTQCGAFRHPNGNTLISINQSGYLFEVTPDGDLVWDYDHPVGIARAQRYGDSPVTIPELAGSSDWVRFLPNRPNPFVSSTELRFELAEESYVDLGIYTVAGRRIATVLHVANRRAGEVLVEWDGRDGQGREVPAGVYLARLETRLRTISMGIVLQR